MSEKQTKKFEISEELANAILNYLAAKPFAEVHQLVAGLTQIKPITDPAPAAEVPQDAA